MKSDTLIRTEIEQKNGANSQLDKALKSKVRREHLF